MTNPAFTTGIDQRYFEDYMPGLTAEYGPIAVEESEIIAFARRYDPQDLHVDPVATGDLRHSWRELHPQHLGAALGDLP